MSVEQPEHLGARIEILPSAGTGYFFRVKAANGEIIVTSGSETYEHPTDARDAIERLVVILPAAAKAVKTVYRIREPKEDEDGD